jgi:predicted PurR-regulated permease PerM
MRFTAAFSPWRLLAAVVLLVLLWHLREPVMLFFGAVLVAATLRALADPLSRFTRLPLRAATALALAVLVLVAVCCVWLVGDPLSQQLQTLRVDLPRAWEAMRGWLERTPLGQRLLDLVGGVQEAGVPWAGIAGAATRVLHGLGATLLILLTGIYLAFDVGLYRDGFLRLVPRERRALVGKALDAAGQALSRWVRGQAVAMLTIGVLVALGLSLLGMPMALALGLISGLLEFVPFVGPIASGLLSVLVAFAQGPTEALYVAALFLALQQVENHLLVPLIQRWAVALPPALALGGVVVFGTLFGPFGVMFGTPLVVVTIVLVQKLYVEPLESRDPG